MTSFQIEIQLIMIVVACSCILPGVFLVLRKMSLISDAISHSILPGIVIGFLITQNLQSPLLILLAAACGLLTVWLVEYVFKLGLVKKDTAIGLVFPAFFSIGILLISQFANDVHLDTDAVLLGDPTFAPFDRFYWQNIDLGPKSLWVSGLILLINSTLLVLFYKELKISSFDANLTTALGFLPSVIHYVLMAVSSITIVGAFDSVGAILVVALMITPAATAYMLTQQLFKMIIYSLAIGFMSAVLGYWVAYLLDASVTGAVVSVLGIIYFIVYFFSSKYGYFTNKNRLAKQRIEIHLISFLLHIRNHESEEERKVAHLQDHIDWTPKISKKILKSALSNNLIEISQGVISLTQKGNSFAQQSLNYILDNRTSEIGKINI